MSNIKSEKDLAAIRTSLTNMQLRKLFNAIALNGIMTFLDKASDYGFKTNEVEYLKKNLEKKSEGQSQFAGLPGMSELPNDSLYNSLAVLIQQTFPDEKAPTENSGQVARSAQALRRQLAIAEGRKSHTAATIQAWLTKYMPLKDEEGNFPEGTPKWLIKHIGKMEARLIRVGEEATEVDSKIANLQKKHDEMTKDVVFKSPAANPLAALKDKPVTPAADNKPAAPKVTLPNLPGTKKAAAKV